MSRTRSDPAGAAAFPGRPPVWNVPRPGLPVVGREDLLDRLHRALHPEGGGERRRPGARGVLLVPAPGGVGVGRAHLAATYAHRHATAYGLVWWLNADTPDRAESCLLDLAAAVAQPADARTTGEPATGKPTAGRREAVLRRLWAELGQRSDWLLVYDNVASPRELGLAAPPDTGRIIMISDDPGAAWLTSSVLTVGMFRRAESVALLRRYDERITPANADLLAAALGDLPLTVALAGHFLAATGLGVPDYLRLLAQHPDWPDPEQRRVAVVGTSRDALATHSPTAALLLDGLALLAAAPMPLTCASTTASARQLARFGLAELRGTAITLHPSVRELLRAGMSGERRAAALRQARHLVATFAIDEPRAGEPTADAPRAGEPTAGRAGRAGGEVAARPLPDGLEQHVHALATRVDLALDLAPDLGTEGVGSPGGDEARLRSVTLRVGCQLRASEQHGSGRELVRRERLRWAERLGPDHPDVLAAADLEAAILMDEGDDPAAARELLADVHRRRVRTFGAQHRDTLRTAAALARAHGELGAEPESARLFEDTLGCQQWLFGADDRDALRSADGLGEVLVRLGEYRHAGDLLGDTWSRRERTSGAGHPDTWWTAAVLGVALRGLGQARHARVLHDRVLTGARRRFGEEHPLTLYAVLQLALDLAAVDEVDAGRDLFTEVIGWDVFGWPGDPSAGPRSWVLRWAARHRADITALWVGG